MENILFSVLVPVYNVEKYIHNCINSVLEQTYSNFELILVDDGSPDNSGRICDQYAANDSRIVVLHKTNGGLMSARRAGIEIAKGDWCIFLDSDDYINPETLDLLNKKATETGSDCIYYGWNNIDDNGDKIDESHDIKDEFIVEDKRELFNLVFLNNGFNSLCRKAVKRNLLSNDDYSSFYRIQHGEDLLQSIEIFKSAEKVLFLPEHLYNYRVNPTSITHTVSYKKYQVNFTVREKVLDFLRGENVWQEKDYANYWAYCVSLFVAEVLMVANFDTDCKTIKSFLKEIANTEYYLNFISSNKYKCNKKRLSKKENLIYSFFEKKYYSLLLFIVKLNKNIKRTKKNVICKV